MTDDRKALALAGVLMALALLLEYLTMFIPKMPQGGKFISLGMVPLVILAVTRGWKWGMLAGAGFGIIYYQIDTYPMINPLQFILDYPMAFGLVGTAGIVKPGERGWKLYCAILLACFLRFLAHCASGIIFFKQLAPSVSDPWIYVSAYNGMYMIPTVIVCLILVPVILDRIKN